MKFTAAIVTLTIASLAFVEAADPQGHAVPLIRNPGHRKNFKAQIAKISHRYPQLNLMKAAAGAPIAASGDVSITDVGSDSEVRGRLHLIM